MQMFLKILPFNWTKARTQSWIISAAVNYLLNHFQPTTYLKNNWVNNVKLHWEINKIKMEIKCKITIKKKQTISKIGHKLIIVGIQ